MFPFGRYARRSPFTRLEKGPASLSSTRCICAVTLAAVLAGCGSHERPSGERPLQVDAVRSAFADHGLRAGRDDTVPSVRRALRRAHVIASLLVTDQQGTSSVAEVRIFDSAARARGAVRRSRHTVSCLGACGQSEALAAVRVRNVVVAPQPLYAGTSADTADLQRLLAAIDALRSR